MGLRTLCWARGWCCIRDSSLPVARTECHHLRAGLQRDIRLCPGCRLLLSPVQHQPDSAPCCRHRSWPSFTCAWAGRKFCQSSMLNRPPPASGCHNGRPLMQPLGLQEYGMMHEHLWVYGWSGLPFTTGPPDHWRPRRGQRRRALAALIPPPGKLWHTAAFPKAS